MATAVLQAQHHNPHRHTHAGPVTGDLKVVLTPIQLAAVLQGASINPHEIAVNRIWGGVALIGGALEIVCGVGELLVPEPTMVTKAAGAITIANGADNAQAGARQLYTGATAKTLAQQGAEFAAKKLGANEKDAQRVGIAVNVAVPAGAAFALSAARVAAIRAGRISLAVEEASGGHTIVKHVAKTEAELRARLAAERIPAASSFSSLKVAEQAITEAISHNSPQIRQWAAMGGNRLEIFYTAGKDIGYEYRG